MSPLGDVAEHSPSTPFLTDDREPNDANLWERVLEVGAGKRREFTRSDRTIHAPNNGRGFRRWPSPKAIAWCVKQYNGFNGGWRNKSATPILARNLTASFPGTEEHTDLLGLEARRLVRRLRVAENQCHYWETTFAGHRWVRASIINELQRRMHELLSAPTFSIPDAEALGKWMAETFRVDSPRTPKGGKELKERANAVIWVLKYRASSTTDPDLEKIRDEIRVRWSEVNAAELVRMFSDEGYAAVIPKELEFDGVTYVNEVGVNETQVMAYAKRLSQVFALLKGWRAKALTGHVKVVLASPRKFNGTVSGKYKTSEDAMWVRATPAILKRGAGYGSFEYIMAHEMGHRYERHNRLGQDFDKVAWHTTRYSRSEGESFAELFALGVFGLTGAWDGAILDRFERVMG